MIGSGIAVLRLPVASALVPVLSLGLFAALILKERVRTRPLTGVLAALGGMAVAFPIDLVLHPQCVEGAYRVIARDESYEVHCLEFVPSTPFVFLALSVGATALIVAWWAHSRDTNQTERASA